MLCFICSFPPFFILFQDMVLVECLLFFLPRNSALIISYSVNIPKSWICRQRAAAERNTEELWSWFPVSTASPDCSQASPVLSTLLLLGPWPHTLSLSTRPFTVYTITFSWGARRIKSLVSLHSNNLHIHKMVMGGGRWGERTDLREAGSAPPPPRPRLPKLKPVSVARISVHLPPTGPLHPAFPFGKWHLRVGHVFIHPEHFTSPLILSPFTSGDKCCPSSFPVVL